MRAPLLLALSLMLVACGTPQDIPHPIVTPNGKKGYSIEGVAFFTHSREEAASKAHAIADAACGGPAKVLLIDFQKADSPAGIPNLHYDLVAECP